MNTFAIVTISIAVIAALRIIVPAWFNYRCRMRELDLAAAQVTHCKRQLPQASRKIDPTNGSELQGLQRRARLNTSKAAIPNARPKKP
jgi:outer membrane protein TolC